MHEAWFKKSTDSGVYWLALRVDVPDTILVQWLADIANIDTKKPLAPTDTEILNQI